MRQISKILAIAIVMLAFSAATFAQTNTAQATASATIVTPITIVKTADMNFGNVMPTATAGTVILAPAGTATYANTSYSATPTATATITAATYTVTGTPAATYSVTLPSSAVTLNGSPTGTMTVSNFTSTPDATVAGSGLLDATLGTQTLRVGATLNVGANQAAGSYVSAAFDVTVNYN